MDPRFDTSKDPRFRQVPRSVRRVKVDKRFAHMFDDKRFVETPKVDSRGQRLRSDSAKSKLREFYELAEDADANVTASELNSERDDQPKTMSRRRARNAKSTSAPTDRDSEQAEEEPQAAEDGDCEVEDDQEAGESSDESDGGSSSNDQEAQQDEGDGLVWENMDHDVPRGDATSRLALMGCEWDHVSATDLLVLLRTYLSSKDVVKVSGGRVGSVDKVTVYPSEYGIEQLEKESQAGPQGLSEVANDADDTEGAEKKAMEAMRLYQLQRTKYYYAVAECDSASTAAALYDQLDGLESAGISPGTLDLRFVPEDMEFPHQATAEATKTPKQYQGPAMERSSALGHTKVHCSWDEAPAHRKRDLMRKRYTPQELEQMDLEAYLASSSEENDASGAENLKSLVSGLCDDDSGDEDEKDLDDVQRPEEGDMEMTFNLAAEKVEDKLVEKASQQQPKHSERGKVHTLDVEKPKTTWEQYLEKRKEKRREKRVKAKAEREARKKGVAGTEAAAGEEEEEEEKEKTEDTKTQGAGEADLELLAMDDDEDAGRGFNVRGKLRTAARRAAKDTGSGDFKVNLNDPRIAKVFGNADFEIDPTNPEYRPSQGMQAVLKKKRERKAKTPATATSAPAAPAAQVAKEGAAVPASKHSTANGRAGLGGLQLFAAQKRKAGADVEPGSENGRASAVRSEGAISTIDAGVGKSKKRARRAASLQHTPDPPDRTKRRKKRQQPS